MAVSLGRLTVSGCIRLHLFGAPEKGLRQIKVCPEKGWRRTARRGLACVMLWLKLQQNRRNRHAAGYRSTNAPNVATHINIECDHCHGPPLGARRRGTVECRYRGVSASAARIAKTLRLRRRLPQEPPPETPAL